MKKIKDNYSDKIKTLTIDSLIEYIYRSIGCDGCPAFDYCEEEYYKYPICNVILRKFLESEV